MHLVLARTMVLLLAGLMTMPPGACCGHAEAPQQDATDNDGTALKPVLASCCARRLAMQAPAPQAAQPRTQAPRSAPTPARADCCCQVRSPSSERTAATEREASATVFVAASQADSQPQLSLHRAASEAPRGSQPPLHVLHCVWRC